MFKYLFFFCFISSNLFSQEVDTFVKKRIEEIYESMEQIDLSNERDTLLYYYLMGQLDTYESLSRSRVRLTHVK